MISTISSKKYICILFYSLFAFILFAALSCSHSTKWNFDKEPEEIESRNISNFVDLEKQENNSDNILQEQDDEIQIKDQILVKNWRWQGAGFGAGGFLSEITLENRSDQKVKDLKFKINYLGTSGPKQGYGGPSSIFYIHQTIPAKTEKTFENVNIGFRHPDSTREDIIVLEAEVVE